MPKRSSQGKQLEWLLSSLTCIGFNLGHFRTGPLINIVIQVITELQKNHNQNYFPVRNGWSPKTTPSTERMCPWERKKTSRNILIKLDFLYPKGSIIFDRVQYKILPQMKTSDFQPCLYPQSVVGKHQKATGCSLKLPLKRRYRSPLAHSK